MIVFEVVAVPRPVRECEAISQISPAILGEQQTVLLIDHSSYDLLLLA